MSVVELQATRCAICGTEDQSTELYPANFSPTDFSPAVFSARRLPDRIHYRLVRCNRCGLVRSDPVAGADQLADLYRESSLDYSSEVSNLAATYGAYLARLDRFGVRKGTLLEVGCGNGFLLDQALAQGYAEVRGVEPSQAAIDLASPRVKPGIVRGMMEPGLFPPASFDVICFFQVLDHILDPAGILNTCYKLLRPGGILLCLNHNIDAFSAQLLKSRSPIVDIEHTYLYSPGTLGRLAAKCGFEVRESGSVRNRYSLGYLTRLVPLSNGLKGALLRSLDVLRLAPVTLNVPLGNLYLIAQKPEGERGGR